MSDKIEQFRLESMENLKVGDLMIHHSGRRYLVQQITNVDDTEKFPLTVTYYKMSRYGNIPDTTKYHSRPLKELKRTMFNSSYYPEEEADAEV